MASTPQGPTKSSEPGTQGDQVPILPSSPHLDSVQVTYTTKSGEVVTTRKMLQLEPAFNLSDTPNAPSLGVAILGYRRFGRKHLSHVVENQACMVHFIIEFDPELAKQAQADIQTMQLTNCEVVSDQTKVDMVCNSKVVNLIIVSSLTTRKKDFVTAAMKAGKTCLVDKPLATTVHDVRELFELARKSKAILLSNLPGRPGKAFSPVIMSLISSSSYTTVERLPTATSSGSENAKCPVIDVKSPEAEAMILDVAMHDVSAINFCMCMRPISVEMSIPPGRMNVALMKLEYPNNSTVQITCCIGQEELDIQQFTLFGDRLSDMRRVDHMDVCDMRKQGAVLGEVTSSNTDQKGIRFNQLYDNAHRDALEQAYAFSSGAKNHAMRVRPHLMEQNCVDNILIANGAYTSLVEGRKISLCYW